MATVESSKLWRGCDMEHWEFLLQKDGDRSWLPLDSPAVEILEGRYRIVARSNNCNAAIDIRIVHLATAEVPPKRRVQKRSCHTNPDGLMVVIPFTRLEPGLWELQCSPKDLLTDFMAGAQPHAVKLQVVARELEEDWDPDWSAPGDDQVPAESLAAAGASVAITAEESITDGVEPSLVLSEAALTEPVPSTTTASHPSSDVAKSPLSTPIDHPVSLPPEVAEMLGASMDRLFQIAEQLSDQLVDEVLQDFDLNAIADAPVSVGTLASGFHATAPDTATILPPTVAEPDAVPLPIGHTLATNEIFALTLDQAAFVTARDERLTLAGRVAIVAAMPTSSAAPSSTVPIATTSPPEDLADPWNEAAQTLEGATAQSLQLCLRDPQSLQILVSDRQPFTPASLPSTFAFAFSLPQAIATHLVLGEVVLCGSLPGQADATIALATQAFSITVDPSALVDELAKLNAALTTEIDDDERIDLPLELASRLQDQASQEQASASLDLSFLDVAVVVESSAERSPRFPSLAGQPLPPQLYQPDAAQVAKPLDLPAFKLPNAVEPSAEPQAESATPEASAPDAIAPTATEDVAATIALASEAAPANPTVTETALPETLELTTSAVNPTAVDGAVAPDRTNTDSIDKTLDLPSPTHMAFQSLKLQDRFLTRLTSLATDTELSALLKANLASGGMPFRATSTASEADVRSLTEEIVVDDEPQSHDRRRASPETWLPDADEPPHPLLVLPADDPVPTPTLDVTTGELISGKPITIRVKLPNLLPRIYVKLWITDRQTRSLLDGPRWLVDFLPNGLGDLEAMIPVTVPFGSVNIRLEAIAVEMHTQRESHKVTVDRSVVPPDLSIVLLDDFND